LGFQPLVVGDSGRESDIKARFAVCDDLFHRRNPVYGAYISFSISSIGHQSI
jgi:hypothetical protein